MSLVAGREHDIEKERGLERRMPAGAGVELLVLSTFGKRTSPLLVMASLNDNFKSAT